MYYIGTYNQTLYYLNKVNSNENYQNHTQWASLIQSKINPLKYAIKKASPANGCPRTYTHANMQLVKELPPEFQPNFEI